jgi:ABC-2 type transport system ATP-binding protein
VASSACACDAAVKALTRFGIRSLVSHPQTLEELMLRHYGDETGSAAAGDTP